jgi:hypothetical protein
MDRRLLCSLALSTPLAFTGCATVMNGETQNVSVQTQTLEGKPVTQAQCSLKNDKGAWKAETPATVQIRKSAQDLLVECKKDGMDAGFARAISRVHASFFGNALIGGGVGAIIDHTKGTAYDYPMQLSIKMGTSTVIDKREDGGEKKDVASAESSASGGATK